MSSYTFYGKPIEAYPCWARYRRHVLYNQQCLFCTGRYTSSLVGSWTSFAFFSQSYSQHPNYERQISMFQRVEIRYNDRVIDEHYSATI